jgi:hypothetical protein
VRIREEERVVEIVVHVNRLPKRIRLDPIACALKYFTVASV